MKTIEYSIGPKTLHLYMNGAAMFEIQNIDADAPDDQPDAVTRMMEQTSDGIATLCRIAHILATQGELCRRYLQYSPERIPTEQELQLLLSPMDHLSLRAAVITAINNGYGQPEAGDGDIDIGLAELEKKTKL